MLLQGGGEIMKIGKVPETVLKRSVFKQLTVRRDEIFTGPNIGEDCSVGQFSGDELFALSCDPITGTVEDIGFLAVHITANDLAASGAEPVGIMLTILLPENFLEEDLKKILQDVNKACEELNIQVMGGHTEVTAAVNQVILSVTGIGKIKKEKFLSTKGVKVGQDVVMTKWAGLEGTSIIAKEKEEELKAYYKNEFIDGAKELSKYISVVPESKVASNFGVSIMHDATEGGVFGALWEIAASARKGIEIQLDQIPIRQETIEICEYYELNPYKLISSGTMIIVTNHGKELVDQLISQGIHASVIGKITAGNDRVVIQEETIRALEPPKSDELYKVI